MGLPGDDERELPENVPFDRRSYRENDEEDVEGDQRQTYRRKEDVMRARALRSKRYARVFTGLLVIVVVGGLIATILIAGSDTKRATRETLSETQKRVTNVSQLCNGINDNNAYIRSVVALVGNTIQLPKPPDKLNCSALINNTLNETPK